MPAGDAVQSAIDEKSGVDRRTYLIGAGQHIEKHLRIAGSRMRARLQGAVKQFITNNFAGAVQNGLAGN